MKLGFITSILDQYGYEQMIDTAAEMGFSCVEVKLDNSPCLWYAVGAGKFPNAGCFTSKEALF